MSIILFPTDLTGYAENAYQYILHLADKLRAKIVFLYVEGQVNKSEAGKLEKGGDSVHKLMHELKFRAADFAYKHDCEIVTEHMITKGDAADEILKAANKLSPMMIALSTKGYNHRTTKHIGNTTATVLRESKFPVLVIPEQAMYKSVQNIALATALDEKDESLIYKLMITAAVFNAKVHVFHVEARKTKGAEQVADYLKLVFKYPLQVDKLEISTLQSKSVVAGIERYIKQHTVDLLCIERHKAFFPELFDIKMSERKSFHETIPTLVYATV